MDRIDFALIVTARGYNTNGIVLAMESRRLKGLIHEEYRIERVHSIKEDRVSKICHMRMS